MKCKDMYSDGQCGSHTCGSVWCAFPGARGNSPEECKHFRERIDMYVLKVAGETSLCYSGITDTMIIKLSSRREDIMMKSRPEMAQLQIKLEAFQKAVGEPLRFVLEELP